MEKDISTKVFQVLDWFRGTTQAQDSTKMLIELLGLKYLAHQSEEGKAFWKSLLDEPIPDESKQKHIRRLFSENDWEAITLLSMLKTTRDADLLAQLFRFADHLDLKQDGYEVAWLLISQHDRIKTRESLSYPLESARLVTMLSRVDSAASIPVNVLCVGVRNLGVALELRKQGAQVRLEILQRDYHTAILFNIAGDTGECVFTPLNDPVSLSSDDGDYQVGVIMPPWGLRPSKDVQKMWSYSHYAVRPTGSESFYIQEALERIGERMIVILPPGFLYRTAGTDLQLKNYLVNEGLIEAVIQLPEKLLPYTMISPVLLVLNKAQRHEDVVFVDASEGPFVARSTRYANYLQNQEEILRLVESRKDSQYSRCVGKGELAENEFNLSVRRYVLTEEERQLQQVLESQETHPLASIASIVRAQAIRSGEPGEVIYEANAKDILDTGYIEQPAKAVFVDKSKSDPYSRQQLKSGDILLAIKGNTGKVGIVPDGAGEDWYAGQSFVILRIKPDGPIKDPIVLYRYLASDFAQRLLASRSAGATVSLIKMQDINTLPVIIPTAAEQQEVLDNNQQIIDLYSEIDSTRHQIEVLKESFWGLSTDG